MPTSIGNENFGDGGTPVTSTSLTFSSLASVDFRHPVVAEVLAAQYNEWFEKRISGRQVGPRTFKIGAVGYKIQTSRSNPILISGFNGGVSVEGIFVHIHNASTQAEVAHVFIPFIELAAFDWTFTGISVNP
jgi:hypothetical protein